MDMHIHMGYCTPESFRILANNYHSVEYHDTYPEIEKLIKEVMVTPAEVAEVLMRNDDADVVLHDLVDFLKSKMKDANEIKAEHKEANNQLDEKKDDKDNEKK
jgi:chaperone BCS1